MSYFLKQHWLHYLSHNEHKPRFWHWLRTYELFVCYILKSAFVNGRSFPLLVSSFIWPLCTSIMHAQSLLKIINLLRSHGGCCCNSATCMNINWKTIILFCEGLCFLFDPENLVSLLYTDIDSSIEPVKCSKLFGTEAVLMANLVPRVCHFWPLQAQGK